MTGTEKTAVIIGAGVIGASLAYTLSHSGISVLVLEQGPLIAEGVTSRNSGVIHAGIYYPPESLKARFCIEGMGRLYEWCEKNSIAHRKTGKYIIGASSDHEELEALLKNGLQSGAKGLRRLTSSEINSTSFIQGDCGLYSENTGIIDPFELTYSFQVKAEEKGAHFSMNTQVKKIEPLREGQYRVHSTQGPIDVELVFNCAGLYADEIAKSIDIQKYTLYPCRGDYFRIKKQIPIPYLVYPVKRKNAPGLGIHLTLQLDGTLKLGPDAYYISEKEDFSELTSAALENKKNLFAQAASTYLQGITAEDLTYDTCGIRPKLRSPQEAIEKDFIISEDLPGFFNLIGIESPGLTSSLAIAEYVKNLLY